MKKKYKFQRTRCGIVVPHGLFTEVMVFLYVEEGLARGDIKSAPKDFKLYAYSKWRKIQALRRMLGSCPESTWKPSKYHHIGLAWYTGEEGLIK